MLQTCRWCHTEFEITDEDLTFYEKVSPVFSGKKYPVPPPTLCPDCRQQRRLVWRNERTLYERTCSGSGDNVICIYPAHTPFPVYDHPYFFSDKWDARAYGREVDFSRPFFEQMKELQRAVPRIMNSAFANENARYGNAASWNKNCYMLFEADNNRDSLYGEYSFRCVDMMDSSYTKETEQAYGCTDVLRGYNLYFCRTSKGCSDSWFLENCIGCKNCFGCVNLINKEYYYYNQPLSKEEYQQKMRAMNFSSYAFLQKTLADFNVFRLQFPQKYMHGVQNENVLGDYLNGCKNASYCFDSDTLRDCKFVTNTENTKDAYDVYIYGGIKGAEMIYDSYAVGNSAYNILFSSMAYENVYNLIYCDDCANSHDLFGCVSLQKGQYCILNKQYTKEEYEALVPKIIEHMRATGEWGEFFPPFLSPFGYNETISQEFFPLSKSDAVAKGFNWSDYGPPKPQVAKIISAAKLPDDLADTPDDILNWAIECEVTGKPFRIVKPELAFYRSHNLSLPRRHPDQRYRDRMALRNPRRLWSRQCDCTQTEHSHVAGGIADLRSLPQSRCSTAFQTTYAPDRPEKVYCEECYAKEVY